MIRRLCYHQHDFDDSGKHEDPETSPHLRFRRDTARDQPSPLLLALSATAPPVMESRTHSKGAPARRERVSSSVSPSSSAFLKQLWRRHWSTYSLRQRDLISLLHLPPSPPSSSSSVEQNLRSENQIWEKRAPADTARVGSTRVPIRRHRRFQASSRVGGAPLVVSGQLLRRPSPATMLPI